MHSNSRDTVSPFILFSQQIGIQEGVEDEASEERHSKRSSDSLIFLDGLRMMYGGPGVAGVAILVDPCSLQCFHRMGLGGVYIKHLMNGMMVSRTAGGHMLLKDAVLDLRKGRRYGVASWLHRRC